MLARSLCFACGILSFFYLDVGPLVLLLFQEVAVFCARGPRRLAAVGSLRGTTSTFEEFQKERDLA